MTRATKRRSSGNMAEVPGWAPRWDSSLRVKQIHGVLKALVGVAGPRATNTGDLFHGGLCESCARPQGERTSELLTITPGREYRNVDAAQVDLSDKPGGKKIFLYAAEFLDLLTPRERSIFEWRPVVNQGRNSKVMFELLRSKIHLRFARLRGGYRFPDRCPDCRSPEPLFYDLEGSLPPWLAPAMAMPIRGPAAPGALEDILDYFVSAKDLPGPEKRCFTTGDWHEIAPLTVTAERWAELRDPDVQPRPPGVRGIVAGGVGIVDPRFVIDHHT